MLWRWPVRARRAFLIAVCSAAVSMVLVRANAGELADAQVEEAGNDVLAGLDHVNELLRGQQWEEAVESLRRVMEDRGDRLIRVALAPEWESLGFATFVRLSEYCQAQLASWHVRAPEALAAYRRRVDSVATQWYAEAVAERSEAKLRRVVDELMLSSDGDQALLRLGEMALERGNYTAARDYWERISAGLRVPVAAARLLNCPAGCSWWLALRGRSWEEMWPQLAQAAQAAQVGEPTSWGAYPDSDIPLADVRARLVLVSILEGSRERAALELKLLDRLHPDARGRLAGREGRYGDLLSELLAESAAWPAVSVPAGWTTLGGSPERTKVAASAVDVAYRVVWEAALPVVAADGDRIGLGRSRVAERADGLLSYHVVVWDGVVVICQPGRVRAVRLADGRAAFPGPGGTQSVTRFETGSVFHWSEGVFDGVPDRAAHVGVPRYSVTVDRGRVFCRMGAAWTGTGTSAVRRPEHRSFLIGIDLATQKMLFDRIAPGEEGWEFEGAPLADAGRLYASLRRRDASSVRAKVVCYAMETGRLLWETNVVRAESHAGVLCEVSNSALAMSDDLLFYATNLGAAAALRADDGRVQWLCRYRRSGLSGSDPDENDRHCFRDMTPCLVHRGLAIVAAADCARVFAVEAGSGRVAWTSAVDVAVDAVHLLGVAQDRLLASGDYVYWMDVWSGDLVGQFPAPRGASRGYAGPVPRGYGRGVLAGGCVYWPTRDRIFVFDQRVPGHARQPIELAPLGASGGNLVVDSGVLLIASPDRLVALNERGWPPADLTDQEPAKDRAAE